MGASSEPTTTTTRLHYRETNDNDVLLCSTTADAFVPTPPLSSINDEEERQPTAFLPQAVQETAQRNEMAQLLDVELVVGRLAMIATVVAFGAEMSAGKSIPDQVLAFVSF